jgi:hypothetical protein
VEEQLVRALAEAADVDRAAREGGAGRVEAGDVGPGQEDLAPIGGQDESRDGRVAIAERDDQVGDLADRLAVPVAHRTADDLGEVEHVPPR